METHHPERLEPGYGICVFDPGGILWSRFGGYADEAAGIRYSLDTVFRAGAVSEVVTAVRVLQLADSGALALDLPVRTYAPDIFSRARPGDGLDEAGGLTADLILSHRSGSTANFFLGFKGYDPLRNVGDFLAGTWLRYPPGARHLRAGGLIDLMGAIVERVDGKPFEESVAEGVFSPLGMGASSFRFRQSPLLADLRYKSGAAGTYIASLPEFHEIEAPSGSLLTTLRDLSALYGALLSQAAGNGPGLVSITSLEALFSPRSPETRRLQGYDAGYIWRLGCPGLEYLGKTAWLTGKYMSHRNVVILAVDLGVGVACSTNNWNILEGDTILPMAVDVLKAYAELELDRPEPSREPPRAAAAPEDLKAVLPGVYASEYGAFRIEARDGSLFLEGEGGYARLTYCEDGVLRPNPQGSAVSLRPLSPDLLEIERIGGARAAARRAEAGLQEAWTALAGTYGLADRSNLRKTRLYSFTISGMGKAPVISVEDAVPYLLRPLSPGMAEILCNEASILFGRVLSVGKPGVLLLDGLAFRRN